METKVDDLRKYIGRPVLVKYTAGTSNQVKVEEWVIVEKVIYTREGVRVLLTNKRGSKSFVCGWDNPEFPKETEHAELFAAAQQEKEE